jgi:hypothetical protein
MQDLTTLRFQAFFEANACRTEKSRLRLLATLKTPDK